MERRLIIMNKKVGFIGCGKMASAIIKGILSSNYMEAENISASEVNEEFATLKREELGIEVLTDNKLLAKKSDIIFLAVKPHFVREVLTEIKNEISSEKLIISIAAGVNTQAIQEQLNPSIPVIRVMPNAPATINEGMSGIVKGKFASDEHLKFVEALLSNIGKCIIIDESQIDVLTAISGSGPAFFYKIIDEMAKAGDKLGLEYKKSLLLAIQTAIGSAKLMLESTVSAEDLIKSVATKGGCTQVGVDFMDEQNTLALFCDLIKKTAEKSKNLG